MSDEQAERQSHQADEEATSGGGGAHHKLVVLSDVPEDIAGAAANVTEAMGRNKDNANSGD